MFTGIVKATGVIESYQPKESVLEISCPYFLEKTFSLGASIAIDGVCLTVSHLFAKNPSLLGFTLGHETKSISLLATKKTGEIVNIEPALSLGDALDGHMVQGHVDGVGIIESINEAEHGTIFTVSYPKELSPYIVQKGSISLDGISLTINSIDDNRLSVCLVPYTLFYTSFRFKKPGDHIHIETDMVGRHLYRIYSLQSCARAHKDIHA